MDWETLDQRCMIMGIQHANALLLSQTSAFGINHNHFWLTSKSAQGRSHLAR